MIKKGRLISREARIETTTLCNAACTICPREKLSRARETMPFLHFCKLADEVKRLGAEMVALFGYGEPLLDPRIADKIRVCTDLGMKTTITTNASLLTPKKRDALFDAGLTEIRFSCHGIGKNYEDVHRKLLWDVVLTNILNFIDANCTVVTNVSVIPLHDEIIDEIKGFWLPLVDHLEIWKPHNWTDGRTFRDLERKKRTCGRPFSGPIQINADGKMMVCCFDYNARLMIGSTHHDTIRDILEGDELGYIQAKHADGNLAGLVCETCDQLNEEQSSPLLFSNRDLELGKTSTFKVKIGD